MSAPETYQPRVLLYIFVSQSIPEDEKALCDGMRALCAREGLYVVDLVVDRGPPKHRASDYPALAYLTRGEVDGVIVVRSPRFQRGPVADRLEQLCPEGRPSGLLRAADLEAAGLLPKPRRPALKRRAAALRASGQNLRQIGQALTAEGYKRRDGLPWSAQRVAELLGLSVLSGGLQGDKEEAAPTR